MLTVAPLCWAGNVVLARGIVDTIHPLSFLLYSIGIGSLVLLPIYFWERCYAGTFILDKTALASILYVSLFPSLVAYFFWNRGVELIGANRAGPFINFIPVFASFMAIVWLNESLKAFHIAGMALFNKPRNYP